MAWAPVLVTVISQQGARSVSISFWEKDVFPAKFAQNTGCTPPARAITPPSPMPLGERVRPVPVKDAV